MKPRRAAAALVAIALAPAAAWAQSCMASATEVAFGTYDPFSASPRDSTGSVSLNCNAHTTALTLSYAVSLSAGGSGNVAARRMLAGANTLDYQLYTGPLRTVAWGDGSGGTSKIFGSLLLNLLLPVSTTHTVYGRMPAAQTGAGAGTYADTITVTISY